MVVAPKARHDWRGRGWLDRHPSTHRRSRSATSIILHVKRNTCDYLTNLVFLFQAETNLCQQEQQEQQARSRDDFVGHGFALGLRLISRFQLELFALCFSVSSSRLVSVCALVPLPRQRNHFIAAALFHRIISYNKRHNRLWPNAQPIFAPLARTLARSVNSPDPGP
jgi:hypothetical protein